MNKKILLKSKKKDKKLIYNGNKKYTFINSTMCDCIKFWIKTKFLKRFMKFDK